MKVRNFSFSARSLFQKSTIKQNYLDVIKADDIFSTLQGKVRGSCDSFNTKSGTFHFCPLRNRFCHRNMIYYVSLYLAIQSRDFVLCEGSMNAITIGPIFHALDGQLYWGWYLIPKTIYQFPPELVQEFKQESLAFSYSEEGWRCMAFNEWHKMDINHKVKNSKPPK